MLSYSVVCSSFVNPWTVAHEAPLSMEFSRQENWSKLPSPAPGDLSKPGVKPTCLVLRALAGGFLPLCHLGSPNKILFLFNNYHNLLFFYQLFTDNFNTNSSGKNVLQLEHFGHRKLMFVLCTFFFFRGENAK